MTGVQTCALPISAPSATIRTLHSSVVAPPSPNCVAAITVPVVTDGTTRLVSHVEIESGAEVTLEEVRATLRTRLQPHAVPSAVMRHRRMPVNVRGKVDRQALADGPFEPW